MRQEGLVENITEKCGDVFYPGFIVTCKQCGSTEVEVENSVGFSAASGGWGEVELVCRGKGCENRVSVFDAN